MKLFTTTLIHKLLILSILLANSCTPSVPKCGDTDTIKTVKEIIQEGLKVLGNKETPAESILTFDIKAIRTVSTDKQTGSHSCAAIFELNFLINGISTSLPITYKVEKTDDGEIYVTTSAVSDFLNQIDG